MKRGDLIIMKAEYNQGLWANQIGIVLGVDKEVTGVKFYKIFCRGEVFSAPVWSIENIN
jgi:hypothetical protein